MRLILLLAAPSIIALAIAVPAEAGLKVCNKAKHPAKVALGRFDGRDWSSEGWWTVAPGGCAEVVGKPLDARYYYLYAVDDASDAWDGGTSFCTASAEKFSIPGRANCAGRGYDRRRFFRIDTQDNLDKVQNLE
jgi:uncharacterized membrane protein